MCAEPYLMVPDECLCNVKASLDKDSQMQRLGPATSQWAMKVSHHILLDLKLL